MHARAATECMRPKVILRRLERHRELQRLRVSGELAEAREGRLERHRELQRLRISGELAEAREGRLERRRELRQLRVSVALYEANGI